MTQAPLPPPAAPKPGPNVYTALLLVAILVLALAIGFVLHNLMSPTPDGYGLSFGEIFGKLALPTP